MITALDKHKMIMFNSAKEIEAIIADYSVDRLSLELHLTSEDPNAMKLLRWYERLIMLCKMDFKRYMTVKAEEHHKLVQFIHDNKLYHCWSELIPWVVLNSDTSERTAPPLIALLAEIGDTWLTFTYDRPTLVTGVARDGKSLIEVNNPYHGFTDNLTELTKRLHDGKITEATFVKKVKPMVTPAVVLLEKNERALNRILFNIIPFINERTKKCVPTNWLEHYMYQVPSLRLYFKNGDREYLDMMHNRKYTLNSRGVTVKLKNAGKIKELLLMEDMTSYGVFYVFFKVTFSNGKESCGYICPNLEYMFNGFEMDSSPDSVYNLFLVVLEVYADLTCAFEKTYKRLYALKEVETFDDVTLNDTNLYVIYEEYEPPEERTGTRKSFTMKSHHRTHATRKLADGKEASEMAKERAREMGIELLSGETFVRPYWTGAKSVREEIKGGKSSKS
jgi:hypothetical protein